MTLDDRTKEEKNTKRTGRNPGLRKTLEGVVERLREGLEDIARGLNPNPQQPVPIPIPGNRARRR